VEGVDVGEVSDFNILESDGLKQRIDEIHRVTRLSLPSMIPSDGRADDLMMSPDNLVSHTRAVH
jgi:hypothetical protein